MNICFAISGNPKERHVGGSTVVDLEFLKHCSAYGCRVLVFTPDKLCFDFDDIRSLHGVRVVLLSQNRFFGLWRHLKISIALINVFVENPQTIFRVNSFFSSVLEFLPLLLFSRGKCKFFVQFHHKDHNRFRNFFVGQLVRRANITFCPSRAAQVEAEQIAGKNAKTFVVHHGVQNQLFEAGKSRRVLDDKKSLNLLFFGRLEERKNPIFLLDVAQLLEEKRLDFFMTIVGNGPLKGIMCDRCSKSQWGDRVAMLDSVSEETKLEIYKQSDIFLFPSRQEGFGLVIAEAMAAGLTVVGFNATATPEIVLPGTGFLTGIDDVAEFATGISILNDDRLLLNKMQKQARKTSRQKFNWSTQMSMIFSEIEKIPQK